MTDQRHIRQTLALTLTALVAPGCSEDPAPEDIGPDSSPTSTKVKESESEPSLQEELSGLGIALANIPLDTFVTNQTRSLILMNTNVLARLMELASEGNSDSKREALGNASQSIIDVIVAMEEVQEGKSQIGVLAETLAKDVNLLRANQEEALALELEMIVGDFTEFVDH